MPFRNQTYIVSFLLIIAMHLISSSNLAFQTIATSCKGNISYSEYSALQDFFLATGGPNWHTSENENKWTFPSSLSAPCDDDWQGISCQILDPVGEDNKLHCSVSTLSLHLANLNGTIPSTLAELPYLNIIELKLNPLRGHIPTQLAQLSMLTTLELSSNRLTGRVPSQFGSITSLTVLDLSGNLLTGPIPFELGNLSSLSLLYLYSNLLSGTIPSALGSLSALQSLFLFENALTGPLPPQLGNLSALIEIEIYNTSITGSIPIEMGGLSGLESIYMYDNYLSGHISSQLGNLAVLNYFVVYGNLLTGSIPTSFGDLSALTLLALYVNLLTGSIPSQLGSLGNLTLLYLNENSFIHSIPSELGNLSSLTQLYLYDNSFTGTIPPELASLTGLLELYVDDNFLTGPIPSNLGSLSWLNILSLYENQLSGTLPWQLSYMANLTFMYLDGNFLTNSIPHEFSNLLKLTQLFLCENFLSCYLPSSLNRLYANMTTLSLADNRFSGTIPASLSTMTRSYELNLSTNEFSGTIPGVLGMVGSDFAKNGSGLNFFGVVVDLSKNYLTGTIPPALFSPQMQTISLWNNCFRGTLPSAICIATRLRTLVMDQLSTGDGCGELSVANFKSRFARRLMEGTVPSCVWALPQLRTLHISGNGLQGTIGEINKAAAKLVELDLSNNFFSGSIPTSLQSYCGMEQLAVANNKLTGTLSEDFSLGNMTLLTLSVNRLSGELPASIAAAPQSMSIDVLSGNLFACGTALPINDIASTSYVCGSSTMDYSLYVWVMCTLLQLLMLAVIFRGSPFGGSTPTMTGCVETARSWWRSFSDSVTADSVCGFFVDTVERCRYCFFYLGCFYVCLCMPVFAILKAGAGLGTLNDQYLWVTTAAYLHGYLPVLFVVAFVCISVAGLIDIVKKLHKFTIDKSTQPIQVRVKRTNILQRLLLQMISVVVVLAVNIFYVYVLLSNQLPLPQVILLQIAMGTFKLLWKNVYIKRFSVAWIRKYEDISGGTALFHEVAMNVFNFVLAPCVATLGTDSNCLYNAVVGEQPILSTFNITAFNTRTVAISAQETLLIPIRYELETVISVTPPWLYSYQCTSALLTNYVPVLVFTFILSGAVAPAAAFVLLLLHSKETDIRLGFLALQAENLFDSRNIIVDMLVDIVIFMTFGLASPLLAVAIVLKQLNLAVYSRLWIGRYLYQAHDLSEAFDQLDRASHCIQGNLSTTAIYLVFVVSIFWGGLVLDMIADVYGTNTGAIISTLSMVGWCITAAGVYYLWGPQPCSCILRQHHRHENTLAAALLRPSSEIFIRQHDSNESFSGGEGGERERVSDLELPGQQRQSGRNSRMINTDIL